MVVFVSPFACASRNGPAPAAIVVWPAPLRAALMLVIALVASHEVPVAAHLEPAAAIPSTQDARAMEMPANAPAPAQNHRFGLA